MRPVIATILAAIPTATPFTDEHQDEAARLLEACCVAVDGGFATSDLAQALARMRAEYGPRLDTIRQAIRAAPIDPVERAGILGAYEMATVIVFNEADRRALKRRALFQRCR